MEPVKLLSGQLHEAGVPVDGVSEDGQGGFIVYYSPDATQEQRDAGAVIVAAFDPVAAVAEEEAEEAQGRLDLAGLEDDITNQLDWIDTTIPEINTGLAAVDTAFTSPAQRAIVRGLLQNQRRLLLQQERELKAWRFVIRRLG